jgi:hypothetical protein
MKGKSSYAYFIFMMGTITLFKGDFYFEYLLTLRSIEPE